jgi:hypothetical protein
MMIFSEGTDLYPDLLPGNDAAESRLMAIADEKASCRGEVFQILRVNINLTN